jgi:hypothetical protein
MNQFIHKSRDKDSQPPHIISIGGKPPGLEIAAITAKNLVASATGLITKALGFSQTGFS